MGSRLENNSSVVRKRIEKHRFEDEGGDEYEPSKFGGFNEYFRRKKIKLQNLDAEIRQSGQGKPSIFRGVVAHVNGYTQPSLNDLHVLIVSHGGGFMQYLDGKTTVTHIIASALTPKKRVELAKYRIVKPAWVVDSIAAGKLLSWEGYRVIDEGPGQRLIGLEGGKVVSQVNKNEKTYRTQTDSSWYTKQVEDAAWQLGQSSVSPSQDGLSQWPVASDEQVDDASLALSLQEELPQALSVNGSQPERGSGEQVGDVETGICSQKETRAASKSQHAGQGHSTQESFSFDSKLDDADLIDSMVAITSDHKPDDTLNSRKVSENEVSPEQQQIEAEMTPEEHNALLLADPRVRKSTVVNPEFLKQYYEESRLHHLSAWKAALKTKLQAEAATRTQSQKSRDRQVHPRRYILHVDFDSFFAAVSLRKFPQYVDKPVVVAHGAGSGAEIASCNYPARKFGIKNGMWMKHAQKMCTSLKVLPYDFPAYEAASRHFYDAVIETGGLVQSVSIDEALIDVTLQCLQHDAAQEQKKADDLAQKLRTRIKDLTGCAVSVGIGGNILLAKVALRRAKPAGQYHVKPDEALEFIGNLQMQDLPGIAHSIGGRLSEIGIHLVKDVRQHTKEKMMNLLGPKTGEKVWEYAKGIDRSVVGDQVVRKSVSAEVNWGIRFATQDQVEEFIESLADELGKRLINEGVRGRQLTMKIMKRSRDAPLDPPKHLGHGKCDTFNKSVVLGVATVDANVIFREALSILRGYGFTPGELRGLGLQMQKLEPTKPMSTDASQKRLPFGISHPATPKKITSPEISQSPDDIETPQKDCGKVPSPPFERGEPSHIVETETLPIFDMGPSKEPLNIAGTQFILPSQVDPEVLKALPADIRSLLRAKDIQPTKTPTADWLPSHSQIDQETLAALPEDVRNEILAQYKKSPTKAHKQAVLPQSPRAARTIKLPKKIVTPTKRRGRGRPLGANQVNASDAGLVQSNFVAHAKARLAAIDAAEEVSEDFLTALPEDLRKEVVAQARQERMHKKGGINLVAQRKKRPVAASSVAQRTLSLPIRPAKPSFTPHHWTQLPDLRRAISEWYESFREEGPYADDTEALMMYLSQVVLGEFDLAKAEAVVKWLQWCVDDDSKGPAWIKTLEQVMRSVDTAVQRRGLGPIHW